MSEFGKIAIQGGTSTVDLGAILANPAAINAEQMYHLTRNLVNAHPEAEKLRESLITALTYDTDKGKSNFGATMTDHFAGKDSPTTVYTSPYARSGAGATIALTYGDTDTQDVYVLLARKKDPSRPGQLTQHYIMPGGYLDAHEPGKLDSTLPYDKNLAATAVRELQEETGLKLPEGYTPHFLSANSDYNVSNTPLLQTVNAFYHVGLTGPGASVPKLAPGDDVAELTWVNAKDISFHPEVGPQTYDSDKSRYTVHMPGGDMNLRDDFGGPLDEAVKRTRAIMAENFKHRIAAMRDSSIEPASGFGSEAHDYHLRQLQRAAEPSDKSWADRAPQALPTTITR